MSPVGQLMAELGWCVVGDRMRSPKPGASLVSFMSTLMRVSRQDQSGTAPSGSAGRDGCPVAAFGKCHNPAVENLEGSDQVAEEPDSIIRSSHHGPCTDVSREK